MYRLKNALAVLFLLGLGMIGPIFNTPASWLMTDLCLLLLLASVLLLIAPLRLLQVTPSGPALSGAPVTLDARGGWWVNLSVVHADTILWQGTFLGHRQIQLPLALARGEYQDVASRWFAGDGLGVLCKQAPLRLQTPLLVLPKPDEYGARVLQGALETRIQMHFGQNDFQIRDFHPYQIGDEVGLIDWHQSARQQQLIVREFDQSQLPNPIFVLINQTDATYEARIAISSALLAQQKTVWLLGATLNQTPTQADLARLTPDETLAALSQPMTGRILVALAPLDWDSTDDQTLLVARIVDQEVVVTEART
ncbi:DUF58 domain-containing protein [Lacticaseibacillus saniviri]